MSTNQLRVIAFFATLAFCAAANWLAGFNFDRRGLDVALGMIFSVWAGFSATMFVDAVEDRR